MKLYQAIFVLTLLITNKIVAQKTTETVRGYVLSAVNEKNIEGVHIQNVNSKAGTISTKVGYFEIEGKPTDLVRFSCISFETNYFTIAELVLNTTIQLKKTSIKLDEILLKPKTWQQFKLEFVQKKLADEESAEISLAGAKQYKGPKTMFKPNLVSAIINPISTSYYILNKKSRQKRKTKRYQKIIQNSYLIED